jgi:hypothetical protein
VGAQKILYTQIVTHIYIYIYIYIYTVTEPKISMSGGTKHIIL